MAKFRNVIIHDYADLDPEIIYEVLQKNLSDLEKLLGWIAEHVKGC